MRGLVIINLAGTVVAGVCAGLLLGRGLVPFASGTAAAVFLVGAFLPFAREHGALQHGFDRVEDDIMDARDREWGRESRAQFFTDDLPRGIWRRHRFGNLSMAVAALLGGGLLIIDFVLFAVRS